MTPIYHILYSLQRSSKPRPNIFLSKAEGGHAKLGDFGLSTELVACSKLGGFRVRVWGFAIFKSMVERFGKRAGSGSIVLGVWA